jgi:hypothetical protein
MNVANSRRLSAEFFSFKISRAPSLCLKTKRWVRVIPSTSKNKNDNGWVIYKLICNENYIDSFTEIKDEIITHQGGEEYTFLE